MRISQEARKVLQFPAATLRAGLQASVEQLTRTREDTLKVRSESEVARRYFGNLVRESAQGRGAVEAVDLEGGAPGVAGGVDAGVMV